MAWLSETAEPASELVVASRARPAPPAAPPGWSTNVRVGEEVDVFYDGAWWEVALESRKGAKVKVVAREYGQVREVPIGWIRPRYVWRGWSKGWVYRCSSSGAAEPRTMQLASGPAPMAHHLPKDEQGAQHVNKSGRSVKKPKAYDNTQPQHLSQHAAEPPSLSSAARASSGFWVAPESVPKAGNYLHVEVADEKTGDVAWKTGLVTEGLDGQRFKARVNGDADFVEEYGMEDEGTEWKSVAAEELEEVKARDEAAILVYEEKMRLAAEQERAAAAAAAEAAAAAAAAGGEGGEGGEGAKAEKAPKAKKEPKPKAEKAAKEPKGKQPKEAKEAKPSGPPKGVTASGHAPKPPPAVASFKFAFGMEVEVSRPDAGFEGSFYSAEVLKADVPEKPYVQYDGLYDPPGGPNLKEEIGATRLRPMPPPPKHDWSRHLVEGQGLEMKHDCGWWQVEFVSNEGGGQLLVYSPTWESRHLVEEGALRPGQTWNRLKNEWALRLPSGAKKKEKKEEKASGSAAKGKGRGKS